MILNRTVALIDKTIFADMICGICRKEFTPNKYRPSQKVCSSSSCQRKRQQENLRQWRQKNPYYFIYGRYEVDWKGDYKARAQNWRKKHPGYLKHYRKTHAAQYREYMREYMHRYRETRPHPPSLENKKI